MFKNFAKDKTLAERVRFFRCSGKLVAPENYSHNQQYELGLRLRRVGFRVRVRSRVKIWVRIRARVKVRVSVRVSVSYIMTIWRWEEFSSCDKFPTTPV